MTDSRGTMDGVRLLGAVTLVTGDREQRPGPVKLQLLLAALAVDIGRTVPPPTLVDRIWDEAPPRNARAVLHTYAARLRRAGPAVSCQAGGYRLETGRERIDLHRFTALRTRAGGLDPYDPRRTELLEAALDLWSGEALACLPGRWAAQVRESLRQQHRSVLVDWADGVLASGRQSRVLERLAPEAAADPLHEPVIERLMRALGAAGRTAEALDLYARTSAHLGEELGASPGPRLRDLHTALLRGESVGPGSRPAAPAQLPSAVRHFSGRATELADLDRWTAAWAADPHALGIVAVTGPPGVGKSALVVHWAHRNGPRFPDGILHADLRAGGRPVSSHDVLSRFLRALGVPGDAVPADTDERAAGLRTLLARRRMLMVLDDAASTAQIRPLLPGTASCPVLVTSRTPLTDLVSRHGAHRLPLAPLPTPDALALLRALGGAATDAEEALARCGNLPLDLRREAAGRAPRAIYRANSSARHSDSFRPGGRRRTAPESNG
ncbi:AfsR/SARP family transcriptional regulator [Symbioplanes lichenis]|uniref:AfsR/SARP family transcriptional regulator n=1 Tax=Symbioplanes lichenis TaxID=1629072 RepID=UPI0027397E18|nr:BTAD domain-containing putative transcriptional regulator [Actinoplanes lichenis]